eukprot:4078841-Amphidinium_carterae.1
MPFSSTADDARRISKRQASSPQSLHTCTLHCLSSVTDMRALTETIQPGLSQRHLNVQHAAVRKPIRKSNVATDIITQ